MDIVDSATRSKMMSGIKGANTKPERIIRSTLHRRGFRFRLHASSLPGKPDVVLPKYNAVILVHGCFWHGHKCRLFKLPSTRTEFWQAKISGNHNRDLRNIDALRKMNFRIAIVWECTLRNRDKTSPEKVADLLTEWLCGKQMEEVFEISENDLQK